MFIKAKEISNRYVRYWKSNRKIFKVASFEDMLDRPVCSEVFNNFPTTANEESYPALTVKIFPLRDITAFNAGSLVMG